MSAPYLRLWVWQVKAIYRSVSFEDGVEDLGMQY